MKSGIMQVVNMKFLLIYFHKVWTIGNSQNIRVWKDSWISLSEQIKPCGPIHETSLDLRVSDLLTSDLQWNKSRIEEILPDFNAQIQCLKPSKEGAEDIFVWLTIQTGVYTTRSGYKSRARNKDYLAPQTAPALSTVELEFNWI